VRVVAIALVMLAAVGGCSRDDTILRITVEAGVEPPPASLVVSLVAPGLTVPPRTIAPAAFPGTIVIHGLPADLTDLCVETEGFDAGGNFLVGGSANVELVRHRTTLADVQMSNAFARCAGRGASDLGGEDLLPATDGGATDMATPICPVNAIFCDDFESGDLSKWNAASAKSDAGTVTVQSTTKAHGTYALRSLANGSPGTQVYAQAEKDFPATAPPFALRANVYFPTTLDRFNQLIALYENSSGSINSFAIGGDTDGNWEVSENESNAPDRFSDMVPTGAGAWHCVELVIDAGGMVDFYVDNHHLVGPWARASQVSYSMLLVGITRSVSTDYVAYIDDVAIGPSRLYCPP
jgi:hypothetical protein